MATVREYTLKYDKRGIKDPLSRLHPDEPWFFVRAQDRLSVDLVRDYAELLRIAERLERTKGNEARADDLLKQALGIMRVASAFQDWQEAHPDLVKLPD